MASGITRNLRLFWRLMWDKRVPLAPKLIVPGTLLYLILPIDLVPDPFLGLGYLDDITLILLGIALFLQLCPRTIVQQHLREIYSSAARQRATRHKPPEEDAYIEAPYQVIDDNQQEGQ